MVIHDIIPRNVRLRRIRLTDMDKCTHYGRQDTKLNLVSVADPMRKVSWMLFPGGTELGTQVKTGSRAGRTRSK